MFFAEPPSNRTISALPSYLRSRPFYVLAHDSTAVTAEPRRLTDSEVSALLFIFADTQRRVAIGARHGQPMLYHFVLSEPIAESVTIEVAIVEELADLNHLIDSVFAFCSAICKVELLSLRFRCPFELTPRGFEVETSEYKIIRPTSPNSRLVRYASFCAREKIMRLGIRCSNTDFAFAILDGTQAAPILVNDGVLSLPKKYQRIQELRWLYQELNTIREKHPKIDCIAIKAPEWSVGFTQTLLIRIEHEAIVQLFAGDHGIAHVVRKVNMSIAKDLGQKGKAKYLKTFSTAALKDFAAKSVKVQEAILVAWSRLQK